MILLDEKRPISALKLIHTLNHTQTNRFCDINNDHLNFIETLDFIIGERIFYLKAGLYKIVVNNNEYVIDVFTNLSVGDYLIIENENTIKLCISGKLYPIVSYKINSITNIKSSYNIESINNSIDIIMVAGITTYTGTPSLKSPARIGRIAVINSITRSGSNSDSLRIPLKHTLGGLPNGSRDCIIINADQLIAHDIINTSREILSGGLNWEYKEAYSDSEYYVFFAEYDNVKYNASNTGMRCSHFEVVPCGQLINNSTKKNCIAASYDTYGPKGIWIKIAASVLDIHGDKDFSSEMKKWILAQAVSNYPIYIEYEISNTIYNTILIDEYHIKTWYPNTNITITGNYGYSIFYKALKQN